MSLSLVTEAKDSGVLTKSDAGMVSAAVRILVAPIKAISPSKEYVSTQEQGMTAIAWGVGGAAGLYFFQKWQESRKRQKAIVAQTAARW